MGPAFLCGDHDPQPCASCGSPGVYLCGWPVEKEVALHAETIVKGDKLRRFGLVDAVVYAGLSHDKLTMFLAFDVRGKVQQVSCPPWGIFKVIRMSTCDAPCCENCVRELDPERHTCRDHWDAWKGIS
jgi:hypothetical protein